MPCPECNIGDPPGLSPDEIREWQRQAERCAEDEAREREADRELTRQFIDAGYETMAMKLHPDKGGSHQAMARLKRVRDYAEDCLLGTRWRRQSSTAKKSGKPRRQ